MKKVTTTVQNEAAKIKDCTAPPISHYPPLKPMTERKRRKKRNVAFCKKPRERALDVFEDEKNLISLPVENAVNVIAITSIVEAHMFMYISHFGSGIKRTPSNRGSQI